MSNEVIKVNSDEYMRVQDIRRVRPVDDIDREALKKFNDKIEPEKFNTQIDTAKHGKIYVEETLSDLSKQGVSFVKISDRSYVPVDNVIKAKDLTDKDRAAFKASTSRDIHSAFKSRVETTAGNVLSDKSAKIVMAKLGKPISFQKDLNARPLSQSAMVSKSIDQEMDTGR